MKKGYDEENTTGKSGKIDTRGVIGTIQTVSNSLSPGDVALIV